MNRTTTSTLSRFGPTVAVVFAALAMTAIYVAVPPSRGAEVLRIVAPAFSTVVILTLVRMVGRDQRPEWLALAMSQVMLVAAHVTDAAEMFGDHAEFPGWSDWFHLAAAAFLVAAGVLRTRRRRPTTGEFGLLESRIISLAAGVCIWLALVEPYLSGEEEGLVATLVVSLVPALGAVAFALSFRLAAHSGFKRLAPVIFVIAVATQTVVDAFRGGLEREGEFGPGGIVAALCIVPPMLIAASLIHSRAYPADAGDPTVQVSAGRTVGISIAVLTPVAVLLVLAVRGTATTATLTVVAVAAVVSVVLALTRMWRLMSSVRVLSERQGHDRLAAMVEHSSDIVLLTDARGVISYASPGLASTLGHRASDWIGSPMIDLVDDHERTSVDDQLTRLIEMGKDATVTFETSLVRADGQHREVEATLANLLGGDAVDGVVATLRDVTEQRALERRLNKRAYYDELTNLANRALFLDRVDHALRVRRTDGDPVVVLFVDLDDFKAINDALGHGVGDQMLEAIAQQIREVSGPGDTPARLGGDEFAVLLEDRGGVDRAMAVAEGLLERLGRPLPVAGYRLTVNASVGVAVAAPGMTTSSLLRDADTAMYEAKRAGKGQVKIFDPAMQLRSTGRLASVTDLEQAFHADQLRVVYQPIASLSTGRVFGAQALLRWTHPERGDVPIDEFIPVAEATGLVVPLGRWLLRQATTEAARWQVNGPLMIGMRAPLGFVRAPTFLEDVQMALSESGLDPSCLALGLPGDAVVDALDGAQGTLSRLRALGVLVSVSDFGTGELSLVDLRRAEFDLMRIEPHFVDEIDGDGSSVARVILETCGTLGIASTAAGVTRPSQIEVLRRLGCTAAMGPLISPPLEVAVVRRRFGVDVPASPPLASVDG